MAETSFCYCHARHEPLGPNPYRVCLECGHVYQTPDDLLAAYRREAVLLEEPERDLVADDIWTCQECVHDF